jgi:hypothetical protein
LYRCVIALLGMRARPGAREKPPPILQVYRDFRKPGSDAAYAEIEKDAARICEELRCPHACLAMETLRGPKEMWFLNGYASADEQTRVGRKYVKKARLLAELQHILDRKKDLLEGVREEF